MSPTARRANPSIRTNISFGTTFTRPPPGIIRSPRLRFAVLDGTALPPALALNLSARLNVGTGDNVLIGGFIINGTDSKQVIVRGWDLRWP